MAPRDFRLALFHSKFKVENEKPGKTNLELGINFVKLSFVQNEEELQKIDYNEPLIRELEEKESFSFVAPTPNNPPWGSLAAFGLWVFSVFCIIIFPNLFVLPYLAQQGIDFSEKGRLTEFVTTDPTSILLQLLAVFPAHILTLVAAWLVVTKLRTFSFRQTLGWNWGGFKFWHIPAIIAFFFGLAAILNSIFGEQVTDFDKILQSSRTAVYLVAFFATFTAPLVEEVIYRGVLYSAFQKKLGVIWGVVLVTVLFALVHVPQYSKDLVPDVVSVSMILLLSLVLTLVRVKTGNLLPCIVLHTVFNGIQAVFLILQPLLEKYSETQNEQTVSLILHFPK
jgi:membrane protease YdiL (CAAX protease family)